MELRTLLAKASPPRSGDLLAGVAAESAEERVRAQMALADLPLKRFLDEAVVPYEEDEVTRLIIDSHDPAAFSAVSHLTVGGFRDWLLSYGATTDARWRPSRPGSGRFSTRLQRPDLGRRLDDESRVRLSGAGPGPYDTVFVVADGLSALAVERHAPPVLEGVVAALRPAGWSLGPIIVVEQGRVAVGDEVGELLGAGLVAVLIGERPGLSAPDSLGIYLTHAPRVGRSDAERNCVSNVRPRGLPCAGAAARLAWLMTEARRRRVTGVALRDESLPSGGPAGYL